MPGNQAILLTPPGVAAIAVVRVSGPAATALLLSHFSKPARPSRAVHGTLRDASGSVIDDCVVVLSDDGRFADLNLHGGEWVGRAVLDLAREAGFEIFDRIGAPLPNEAIDATDTIDREIEAYLPLATTELALRTLLAQGDAWRGLLKQIQAGEVSATHIRSILEDRSLDWLLHPPRVAIVGEANVGKSTLANRLFAQERSITADVPGTTRDWVGEMANLDGLAVQLVDTPGIRETQDAIEREAIQRSGEQIRRADLVVLVLDATRPLSPEQSRLIERFPAALRVINKVDATCAWALSSVNGIHTVATTGKGVDELIRRIRENFGCEAIDSTLPRCWTPRQRASLMHSLSPSPSK